MTKWSVQKQTQGTTQKLLQHHDATDLENTYFLCFSDFSFFIFFFVDNYNKTLCFSSGKSILSRESVNWMRAADVHGHSHITCTNSSWNVESHEQFHNVCVAAYSV